MILTNVLNNILSSINDSTKAILQECSNISLLVNNTLLYLLIVASCSLFISLCLIFPVTKIRTNCSDISCSLIEMMWRSNSRNAVSFSILCMIKSIWHSKTWKMSRKKNLKKMKVQLMHLWEKGMMVLKVRVCRNRDKDLARTRCTRHTAATLSAWLSSSC